MLQRQGQGLQEKKSKGLGARSEDLRSELGNSLDTNQDTSEIIHIADLIAREEDLKKRREKAFSVNEE